MRRSSPRRRPSPDLLAHTDGPVPTFRDLRTYLEREGWQEVANLARGRRRIGDHRRYRKVLPDGSILRTKVSHALDDEIGSDLLGHIIGDQLRTTMEHFRDVLAGRSTAPTPGPDATIEPIPGWLVMRLIHTAGLSEDEVRAMSVNEARTAWERHTSGEGEPRAGAP